MAAMTRTITTAAAFPPSSVGSVSLTSGPSCRRRVGTAGTAVKEVSVVGGRQIFLLSFTVGVRPLGQEQTTFPSFNLDSKVSGQTQVAVTELEEENYMQRESLKKLQQLNKTTRTPCDQANVGAA